jgi:maltose alpha-D-glucosyltransferase/alpha-amylase
MRRFLVEHGFKNVPALTGSLEYARRNGDTLTPGMITEFLPHAKDGWEFTMDALGRYFQRIGAMSPDIRIAAALDAEPFIVLEQNPSEEIAKLIGTYFEIARLLGQRTAEMHLVLASDPVDPAFAPEPFTPFYQRSLYQSMRNLAVRALQSLRHGATRLPESDRPLADNVSHHESQILKRLQAVHETRISAKRIRCHGDLHLGEVLHTGKDFVFVDFEGDPRRPLSERRIKRTALRDVASLIRSFDYVAYAALFKQVELGILNQERLSQLEPWAVFWHRSISGAFLRAYCDSAAKGDFLPKSEIEFRQLLTAHLLEKAIHEVAYEVEHRPAWARIPLRAILRALEQWAAPKSPSSSSWTTKLQT